MVTAMMEINAAAWPLEWHSVCNVLRTESTESGSIRSVPVFVWSGWVELGDPGFGHPQMLRNSQKIGG
jgi:hypothetical protein